MAALPGRYRLFNTMVHIISAKRYSFLKKKYASYFTEKRHTFLIYTTEQIRTKMQTIVHYIGKNC